VEDIGGRESEQAVAAVQQSILPAIVRDQTVAMASPVVLQGEFVLRVVQIGMPEEPTVLIEKRDLGLRAG
jgi:hypothetical protein